MGVVTTNSIRGGVILALSLLFPDMDVYGEKIPEGFETPCLFVKLLTAAQDKEMNRRYKRSYPFDIHFFPHGHDYNREGHEMAERLYDALRIVDINGDLYKGTGMNHEIVDDVLHFFVDFNFHVLSQKEDEPVMQTLEQKGVIK
ncbi:phage tail terminator family protein [Paenibacillus selenitireducens]|uniref:phage tail terminator family protein n=1 Tax=Paenibacillus selenitireducens TaxID=1324314 RepID=UPI001E468504|nr:hypothetical protein [Paenibacillus selenitireducens]